MSDMLVKLYGLPALAPIIETQTELGITLRCAIAPEKHHVLLRERKTFSEYWVNECDIAFSHQPITAFLAVEDQVLVGFACYETTKRGFFGPTGVSETGRGRGVGKALLLICLHDVHAYGYEYAIIGAAGPIEFYQKAVGAVVIEDSTLGVYEGMLRK